MFKFLQCDLYVLLMLVRHNYQMWGTRITKIYGHVSLNLGPYQVRPSGPKVKYSQALQKQLPHPSSQLHPYKYIYTWVYYPSSIPRGIADPSIIHMFLGVPGTVKVPDVFPITFGVDFSCQDIEVWDQSPQDQKIRCVRGDIILSIRRPCYIHNKILEYVIWFVCVCVCDILCIVAYANIQNTQLYGNSPMNKRHVQNTSKHRMYISFVVGGFNMFQLFVISVLDSEWNTNLKDSSMGRSMFTNLFHCLLFPAPTVGELPMHQRYPQQYIHNEAGLAEILTYIIRI